MTCSRDLDLLVPEFKDKYLEMQARLKEECGVEVVPYCTIRDPLQQAREWRSTRSSSTVKRKITELKNKNAPFLAKCIKFVGPQSANGRRGHVTNAIPGFSWHQWGEAVDSYWEIQPGVAAWSAHKKYGFEFNAYREMERIAEEMGMRGLGSELGDWPHVQFRAEGSPKTAGVSIVEMDSEMEARYGHLLD